MISLLSGRYLIDHINDILGETSSTDLEMFNIMLGDGSQKVLTENMQTCFAVRNFPHLRTVKRVINLNLAQVDWVEKFRYTEDLPSTVLIRLNHLAKEAPTYYDNAAHPTYLNVIKKLNKEKLLTSLSKNELIQLDNIYPQIIDY